MEQEGRFDGFILQLSKDGLRMRQIGAGRAERSGTIKLFCRGGILDAAGPAGGAAAERIGPFERPGAGCRTSPYDGEAERREIGRGEVQRNDEQLKSLARPRAQRGPETGIYVNPV